MGEAIITARIGPGLVAESDPRSVPWWSFTKTVLAAAALRLVERGRLGPDARFEGRSFTLRQLLQHQSGLPDYGSLPEYHAAVARGDAPWGEDEMLARCGGGALAFEPGQGWGYSNVGYLLVRRAVENATGLPIGPALRGLVLDELGLDSVRVLATAEELGLTAWGNARGYDPRWVYHGLLAGTARDAAALLDALLSGRLLAPATVAEMRLAVLLGGPLPDRPWQATGYGLGLMIGRMAGAGEVAGHSGSGPGSTAAVYRFDRLATPVTIAAFAPTQEEGVTEREAVRLATAPP